MALDNRTDDYLFEIAGADSQQGRPAQLVPAYLNDQMAQNSKQALAGSPQQDRAPLVMFLRQLRDNLI